MTRRRHLHTLAAAASCLAAIFATAGCYSTIVEPLDATAESRLTRFDAAWELIGRDAPYIASAGIDWDEVRDHYRAHAALARDDVEFAHVLAAMLAELGDQHAGLEIPSESTDAIFIRPAGFRTLPIDGRIHVATWPEGEAPDPPIWLDEAERILPRLVAVSGHATDVPALAAILVAGHDGTEVELEIEWADGTRQSHSLTRQLKRIELSVTPALREAIAGLPEPRPADAAERTPPPAREPGSDQADARADDQADDQTDESDDDDTAPATQLVPQRTAIARAVDVTIVDVTPELLEAIRAPGVDPTDPPLRGTWLVRDGFVFDPAPPAGDAVRIARIRVDLGADLGPEDPPISASREFTEDPAYLEAQTIMLAAIETLRAAGAEAIVLDLTDNSGGYALLAGGFGSALLREPWVVHADIGPNRELRDPVLRLRRTIGGAPPSIVDRIAIRPPAPAALGGAAAEPRLPLVIAACDSTGSAAELMALGLRDAGDATIVGRPTKGAGAGIQEWGIDGWTLRYGALRLTDQLGRDIDRHGVTPNVPVRSSADDVRAALAGAPRPGADVREWREAREAIERGTDGPVRGLINRGRDRMVRRHAILRAVSDARAD